MADETEKRKDGLSDEHGLIVDRLATEYEDVAHLVTPAGDLFVFRRPEQDAYEDYLDGRDKKKRLGPLYRDLTDRSLVHGDLKAWREYCKRKPAVAGEAANVLLILATSESDVTAKKG